jgi:hypothetical protein
MNPKPRIAVAAAFVALFLIFAAGAPADEKPGSEPAKRSAAKTRRPRFRVTLTATLPIPMSGYYFHMEQEGTFRFPQESVPGEAGPFAVTVDQIQPKFLREFYLGPLSLTCDLAENIAAEIELLASGRADAGGQTAWLSFWSSADSETYVHSFRADHTMSFVAALAGLAYRTKAPSASQANIIEIGAAAGPAWTRLGLLFSSADFSTRTFRKTALTWRLQAAFDHYFTPTLSLGAFAGYRSLGAEYPGTTVTADLGYWESDDITSATTPRTTEVTLPGPKISWSGYFFAVRIGIRI